MLSAAGCQARRQRLWERLEPQPDVLLLADPAHLIYFANYWQSPFVFRSNDAAALLLLERCGKSVLCADNLLRPFTDLALVDEVVAPIWYEGKRSAPPRRDLLMQSTLEWLRKTSARVVGCEPAFLPLAIAEGWQRPGLQFVDITGVIFSMRRQKDEDERQLLRRSVHAGDAGLAAGLRHIEPGISEFAAYQLVQHAAQSAAGEAAIVYGDFVSGPRCEQVGGPPTARRIAAGDLVILDFSTVLHGYRADTANTFVCGSTPTARERELHQACLSALGAGERALGPGVPGREVHAAVQGELARHGLGKNMPGHAGHGIGLSHPEAPFFVPESTCVVQVGDVVTLEPGQYIPGVAGMRFERNYLITETGFEVLSRHELRFEQP